MMDAQFISDGMPSSELELLSIAGRYIAHVHPLSAMFAREKNWEGVKMNSYQSP
jgi:hypothetical protein